VPLTRIETPVTDTYRSRRGPDRTRGAFSMEDVTGDRLDQVLRQTRIPVLIRRPGHPLRAQLPYDPGNRSWLQEAGKRRPAWIASDKQWELPHSWFSDLLSRSVSRFGKAYVIQPYNEQEKCAPACWNAVGDICECSCMGVYHGSGHPGGRWKVFDEAFATRWRGSRLACRLVGRRD
jgi:hypothetical protein